MPRKNFHEHSTSDISSGDQQPVKLRPSAEQLRRQEAKRLAPFVYLEDQNVATREAFLDFIEDGNTWRSHTSKSKNVQGLVVVLRDAPQTEATPEDVVASFLRYTTSPDHDIETDYSGAGDAQFISAFIAKSALERVLNNSGYTFKGVADGQVRFFGSDRILPVGDLMVQGNNFTNKALGVSIDTEFAFSDYDKVVTDALSDVVMSQDILLHVERAAMVVEHNPHLNVPVREVEFPIDIQTVFDLATLAQSDGGFSS